MSAAPEQALGALAEGARWLAHVARVASPSDQFENPRAYSYSNWLGAVRNEYDTKTGTWTVNGPVWHTGQAIRSLLIAHRHIGDLSLLEAAKSMGRFILSTIVDAPGDTNHGLLLAYEGDNATVNNQTVFETVPGLLDLAAALDDRSWIEHAHRAVDFTLRGFMPDEALIVDHYHVGDKRFVHDPDNPLPGRPLLDGGVLVALARATGDERYLRIFLDMAERAVREERPEGTWMIFPPWRQDTGRLHVRTSWWWGYPLLLAYDVSGDRRFWDAALRVGGWYLAQQNLDGGFYYSPLISGKHSSFGLATSGAAVATIIWADLYSRTGDRAYREAIGRSIRYVLRAQFSRHGGNTEMRGAFWETPNVPDGTSCPGFLIRDIATIFAIQALDRVLVVEDLLHGAEAEWDHRMQW
jgi:hypothetical protein